MNDTPPSDGEGDALEELYRRSCAQNASRPRAATRKSILTHSAQLAAKRTQRVAIGRIAPIAGRSGPNWRRPVLFGSLTAAALAGLLVAPRFLHPRTQQVGGADSPVAAISASKSPNATASFESARAANSAAAPLARNVPVDAPPAGVRTPAPQVARSAATSEATNAPTVTGKRVRHGAYARTGNAAALVSQVDEAGASSAPAPVRDATVPIGARDPQGRTALMVAVMEGHVDAVVALLQRGADPNATDAAGMTPLQVARANHQPEIIDALIQGGAR